MLAADTVADASAPLLATMETPIDGIAQAALPADPDGRDDLPAPHEWLALLARASAPVRVDAVPLDRSEAVPRPTTRKIIAVSKNVEEMTDKLSKVLSAQEKRLYVRGGQLVKVTHGQKPPTGITRDPSAPTITRVTRATMTEWTSSNTCFQSVNEMGKQTDVYPPKPVVDAILDRGFWPGVRPIEGVVTYPILRPDGTVVAERGYDDITGIYCAMTVDLPVAPDSPTRDDARCAVAYLLDVVCDFPFASGAHKSAWLAALLTPLVRATLDAPVPLFFVEANLRAAGKTLLADLIGVILTGAAMTHTTNTSDDEEMRKKLGAFFLAGDPLVLFDNAVGEVGTPALDNVLTSTSFTDRILGKTENLPPLRNRTTFFATGNNPVLREDTARRSLVIRLESPDENPERREGFVHKLPEYATQNRGRLLAAMLTVLRAFGAAGRPRQAIPAFGSFDEWSAAVREPIVWLGLPDPIATNQEALDSTAGDRNHLADVLRGWSEIESARQRGRRGLKASEVLAHLESFKDEFNALADALRHVCPSRGGNLPDARRIGKYLRENRLRWVDGMRIVEAGARAGSHYWTVERCYPVSPSDTQSVVGLVS